MRERSAFFFAALALEDVASMTAAHSPAAGSQTARMV
jgi:hypothetical protein